uniref:Uncharacterized protein n=1 Tax=Heliothis virescens TaxID=7102 RepID=A0A2A4JVB1_HELVI
MRLKICLALVLVIIEGSYCIPSTFVETTGTSWGYEFNLNNSNGYSATYDKKNGLQFTPLDSQNNTGFHKKYTERTVHDQYASIPGQAPVHKLTVNEYVETNKPSNNSTVPSDPNGTAAGYSQTGTTTGHVDPRSGPLKPVTSPLGEPGAQINTGNSGTPTRDVPSNGGEPREPANNVQPNVGGSGPLTYNIPSPLDQPRISNRGGNPHDATNSFQHHVLVGALPDTSNVAIFNRPYGYNRPPYDPFDAPVYNNPNPMYGVPGNQMYTSWARPMGSVYVPVGSVYEPTVPVFGSAGSAYDPRGSVPWQRSPGSVYGPTGSAYGQTGQSSSQSWMTQRPQSGQQYDPGFAQTYFTDRRPMYGVQRRIYE